jgi:Zn-dependent metalloprotease
MKIHQGHRRPCCYILPPHILRQVACAGSAPQRTAALGTMATDQSLRLGRATFQLLDAGAHQALMSASDDIHAQRTIYDAKHAQVLPGQEVASEHGPAKDDPAIKEAFEGLGATFDFFYQVFGRNSIDDEGLHLDATVHYRNQYDNAFWNGQQMVFGDGDGELFNRFTLSLDVIGHELTHGVIGDETKLIYMGQPGALNESIADVFGSLVKQHKRKQTADKADWLIGAELLMKCVKGKALRSLAEPGTAYDDPVLGKDPQPATMLDYVHTSEDFSGVHINSGIPNRAFFLVATKLGGFAWEKAGRIWYDSIRDKNLKKTATFHQFAHRTAVNAGHLFGSSSPERKAVIEAWTEVGIKP